MTVQDVAWFVMDQLPKTGVKISMIVFGGLTLLILGGGVFLASRRGHRAPPPPSPSIRLRTTKTRRGFDPGTKGQAVDKGGESGPPDTRTGGVN